MFGADGPSETQGPQPPQRPQMPPKKTFQVRRFNVTPTTEPGSLETLTIDAHFMAPLEGGGMAFNVYDFDTPQGVSTIRVLSDYYDIEMLPASGIVH
jgi:hypothetical protein